MTYELHPLCTLFPRLSGSEFESLRNDIQANGLRTPIVLHEGMILDGGNRYRACIDAGIEPKFVSFDGANLVSFVLSANLHRRHMSPGQQAAIVASAQDWAQAQTVGNPQLRNVAQLDTAKDRAAQSGASHRTQQMADKVAKVNPELAKQVALGEISLPKAVAKVTPKKPLETASAPDAGQEDVDDYAPDAEELALLEAEHKADLRRMELLLDSDDALAAVTEENKKLTAQLAALQLRLNSLLNEKSAAIDHAEKAQRKADRLAKDLEKLKTWISENNMGAMA